MIPVLPGAVPEIPVSDLTAAAMYYRDNLSFSLDWIAADIALAAVSRDSCRLFLAQLGERVLHIARFVFAVLRFKLALHNAKVALRQGRVFGGAFFDLFRCGLLSSIERIAHQGVVGI